MTEALGESSLDQGAQRKEIDGNIACSETTSDEDDNSIYNSKNGPSTKVGKSAIEEENYHQQQGIKCAYE